MSYLSLPLQTAHTHFFLPIPTNPTSLLSQSSVPFHFASLTTLPLPLPFPLPSNLHQLTPLPSSQEIAKKRTRRTVKQQRGIVGAPLELIKDRRGQRPEAREAARKEALTKAKAAKSDKESKKKAEKAKSAKETAAGKVRGGIASKQGAKGAPTKVSAKTR